MKLLFVCTGNICRSAMAEFLAKKLAAERKVALEARSCGLAADHYFQVPPEVWAALEADGISPREHRPQLAGRKLLEWADWVLVMTARHRDALLDAFPEWSRKLRLLREHAGLSGEVPDPYGRPAAEYARARGLIVEALDRIIAPR